MSPQNWGGGALVLFWVPTFLGAATLSPGVKLQNINGFKFFRKYLQDIREKLLNVRIDIVDHDCDNLYDNYVFQLMYAIRKLTL